MQDIVIIDCGSGNLHSCAKAVERVCRELSYETRLNIVTDANLVNRADKIILPGQGAFRTCMMGLQAMPDMPETLHERVIRNSRPFFGICVGMQLLGDYGYEHEATPGLGWLGGDVVALRPQDKSYKIPHMGWNNLRTERSHPLLPSNIDDSYVYFVHSYHLQPKQNEDLLLSCDYGERVTAMVCRDNFAGTQFHPEKSGAVGLSLLRCFLEWNV